MSKTGVARMLRKIGAGAVVDNRRFRRLIGAPLYTKHLNDDRTTPAASSPSKADESVEKVSRHEPRETARPEVLNPSLSIIVPVYNVENYVAETLESIIKQTYEDFEVIVVNDGSTDDSLNVVNRVAAKDKRIRVISKENGGLGAARNTGVEHSRAPYITFSDSDDVLPPNAYQVMMRSITCSGSDVVIGGVERFTSGNTWTPEWAKVCHDRDRIGIAAEEFPEILWDVYAWNKIYRRTSWDKWVGAVPENILYEDQECSGKLYVGGAKLDILQETVYYWRLREDGGSITQQKTSLKDLRDRLMVIDRMMRLMTPGPDHLSAYWFQKIFTDDLYWYYRAVPRADEEFWVMLRDAVPRLHQQCPPEAFARVPIDRRVLSLILLEGSREEFESALISLEEIKTAGKITHDNNGSLFASLPLLDTLSFEIDKESLRVEEEDLSTVGLLRDYKINDGEIVLYADCYVEGWDHSRVPLDVKGTLSRDVSDSRSDQIQLTVERWRSPWALIDSTDDLNDYSEAGVKIRIPWEEVTSAEYRVGPGTSNRWRLELAMTLPSGNELALTINRKDSRGGGGNLRASSIDGQARRLAPMTFDDGSLGFEVIRTSNCATAVTVGPASLSIDFSAISGLAPGDDSPRYKVVASNRARKERVEGDLHEVGRGWRSTLYFPIPTSLGRENFIDWDLHVVREGAVPTSIAADFADSKTNGASRFVPRTTGYGFLSLREQRQFGEVTEVRVSEDHSEIAVFGKYYLAAAIRMQNPTFALVSSNNVLTPRQVRTCATSGDFEAQFDLTQEDVNGSEVQVPSGLYIFQLLGATKQSLPVSAWLPCSEEIVSDMPMDFRGARQRIVLTRTPSSGALAVDLRSPLRSTESGRFQQRRHVEKFFGATNHNAGNDKLEQAVLFESFSGRSIQDSPKALDRVLADIRPDIRRYWTVRDHSVSVPDGATPVVIYSEEWYRALATSKYLVNNNNFPFWFRKRDGQIYVQTWHGTPLKRIGNDVPSQNLTLSYRSLMKREADAWDYLLAQSPWAEATLQNAFEYSGKVITVGYPRNDALLPTETSFQLREKVREFFRIAPQQKVILYAPTWRDNAKDSSGKYRFQTYLDFKKLHNAFGEDAIVFLRGHSNISESRRSRSESYIREVTAYPDMNELMLAADVLVTDYSSSMFDFVVTGKPIVFLAPDLDEYRDSLRGFYFDFEEHAPGPICRNTLELIRVLQSIFSAAGIDGRRYSRFAEGFAPLDDGHAAQRVAELIWKS